MKVAYAWSSVTTVRLGWSGVHFGRNDAVAWSCTDLAA